MIQIVYRQPLAVQPATISCYISGATPMVFDVETMDDTQVAEALLGYSTAEVTAEVTEKTAFIASWMRALTERLLLNAVRVKSLEVFTMQEGSSTILLEGVMRGWDEVFFAVRRSRSEGSEIEISFDHPSIPDSRQSKSERVSIDRLEDVDMDLAHLELDELTPTSKDLVKVLDATDRLLALTLAT